MTIREIPANYNTKVSVVFLHVNLLLVLSIPATVTQAKCSPAHCIVKLQIREMSVKPLDSNRVFVKSEESQKARKINNCENMGHN